MKTPRAQAVEGLSEAPPPHCLLLSKQDGSGWQIWECCTAQHLAVLPHGELLSARYVVFMHHLEPPGSVQRALLHVRQFPSQRNYLARST